LLQLIANPPYSSVEPVTEVLHGVPVTDPYRWLEDQESPRTREWLAAQTQYARAYLDAIPGRERIRERIRDLLLRHMTPSRESATGMFFASASPARSSTASFCVKVPTVKINF